ncbi:hypothetical protein MY4824_001257 [Beauveria thailandica]
MGRGPRTCPAPPCSMIGSWTRREQRQPSRVGFWPAEVFNMIHKALVWPAGIGCSGLVSDCLAGSR